MKIFIYIAIGFLPMITLAQPKMTVDKSVVKLEKVKEGEIVRHVFKVKNTGDAPLVLTNYNVGCPCTKVTLPQHPITPGQTVDVPMEFDSKGKYGFQDRIIFVNTNMPNNKEYILRFKIIVK